MSLMLRVDLSSFLTLFIAPFGPYGGLLGDSVDGGEVLDASDTTPPLSTSPKALLSAEERRSDPCTQYSQFEPVRSTSSPFQAR